MAREEWDAKPALRAQYLRQNWSKNPPTSARLAARLTLTASGLNPRRRHPEVPRSSRCGRYTRRPS